MVSLFSMALFGIFTLMIMGIISNTSQTAITAVENQMFLMNCPLPLNGARPDPSSVQIEGLILTYDTLYDNSTDYHVTVFHCRIVDGEPNANTEVYTATTSWFDTTTGTLFYASATLTALGQKIVAFLTLFAFILTPANFEILGFGLADMSGAALAVIVGIYLISYVFVGIWVFTTISGAIGGFKP